MFLQGFALIVVFTQAYGLYVCYSRLFAVYPKFHFGCISREKCLQKKLVIYEKTCLHKCPRTYCSHQGRVVVDRRCVDACPDDVSYQHDHVCYDVCPGDTVGNDSYCIPRSQCLVDMKVLGGTCVEDCPIDHLLTEGKECVSSCPPGTVEEANLCISEDRCITSRRRVIYNNSCLVSCPPESPLSDDGVCKINCPLGKFTNENKCESNTVCTAQGKLVFNSTCRPSCPDIAPLSYFGRCVSECPETFFADESLHKCIHDLSCVLRYKVIFNGKCINSCPETTPFVFAGYCRSKCPNNTLIRFNQCISVHDCVVSRRFQYGSKCVNACPKEATYRMFYSHPSPWYSICVTTCPEETVRNETEGKCLDKKSCFKHNVNAVVFNNSCADFCPSSRKYNYSSVCYAKCPENTYPKGVQCLASHRCTSSSVETTRRVFYRGSCLERCPPEAQYELSGYCVALCPNSTRQHNTFCLTRSCTGNRVFDGDECVTISTCQDEGKSTYDGECIRYCPYGYFRYSSSCRKLPHKWLSFGLTGLMCLLCNVPIVLVLYSPRKLCGSRFNRVNNRAREIVDY